MNSNYIILKNYNKSDIELSNFESEKYDGNLFFMKTTSAGVRLNSKWKREFGEYAYVYEIENQI